jgi:hypothetical protein
MNSINTINLKFSNILEHLDYERWYYALYHYIRNKNNYHNNNLAFYIENLYDVNVPEEVNNKLNSYAINDIINDNIYEEVVNMNYELKSKFKDINKISINGYWLEIEFIFLYGYKDVILESIFNDEDINDIVDKIIEYKYNYDYTFNESKEKKERLNIPMDLGIESKEMLYMSKEIEKYIKERFNLLHDNLESMEFWEPYIDIYSNE